MGPPTQKFRDFMVEIEATFIGNFGTSDPKYRDSTSAHGLGQPLLRVNILTIAECNHMTLDIKMCTNILVSACSLILQSLCTGYTMVIKLIISVNIWHLASIC